MCVMLTSDVNCRFTPPSEKITKKIAKKLGIIDQPRFHADMQKYVIKMSPYLVTDPVLRLYELSGPIQELLRVCP